MEGIIIGFMVGGFLGAGMVYLIGRSGRTKQRLLAEENIRLNAQLAVEKEQATKERLLQEESHLKILETRKAAADREILLLKESFDIERKVLLTSQQMQKQNFEEAKVQIEKQWKERNDLLKTEFEALANAVLEKKTGNLQHANKEQLDAILTPLRDKIQHFEKAVKDSQISGAENKASMEKAIEEMMKRVQDIGHDAVNLTRALKGNSKTQGDWGEMLLESILEKSGLRKEEEYFVQESSTVEGERIRPDVVVRFPEKRSVIIDSKVSLTAYVQYTESDDEKDRALYLKNHIKSIREHIDELNERNYSQYVEHSIGYVLMFVPNEASYILAVQSDPALGEYAYGKRIVLISPTNLMMALQLAYNLWQSERQSQNVREIVRQGSDLYDKFVSFAEAFSKVGAQLHSVQNTYHEVSKLLSEGKGNLMGRVERMRKLGLTPKKRLAVDAAEEEEGDPSGEE